MHELPTWVKKTLDAVGINSGRAQWKYHYFREGLKEKRDPLGGRLHWLRRRQKACARCGTMVSPDESRCPECGARIPSRLGYLLRRMFGFMGVQFGAGVTPALLTLFIVFYAILKFQEIQGSGAGSDGGLGWGQLLILWGALFEPFIDEYGQWWRIFTMGLLHGGIIHLAFNSYAFLQLGPLVEHELGAARTLVLITVAQVAAAMASLHFGNDPAFSVGASGFLFGLIGFGVGYYWKQSGSTARVLHGIFVQWGLYALIFGFVIPRVDNAAHIGGGIAGIVLGLLFQKMPSIYHSKGLRMGWTVAGFVCVLLWAGSVVLMLLSQKDIAF